MFDAGAGALPAVCDRLLSKIKGNGDNIPVIGIGRPDSQLTLRLLQFGGDVQGILLCEEGSRGWF